MKPPLPLHRCKLSITSSKKIGPHSYTQGTKKSVVVEKKMYRKKLLKTTTLELKVRK